MPASEMEQIAMLELDQIGVVDRLAALRALRAGVATTADPLRGSHRYVSFPRSPGGRARV